MKYIPKFQQGSIITNDPNDPRLKFYQDSLKLSNKSAEIFNKIVQTDKGDGRFYTIDPSRYDGSVRGDNPAFGFWGAGDNIGIQPISINIDSRGVPLSPNYKKPIQPVIYQPFINRMQSKGLPIIPQLIPNERIMPDVIYKDNNIPNAAYTGFDITHFTDSLGRWAAKFNASTTPGIRGKISTPNSNGNFITK